MRFLLLCLTIFSFSFFCQGQISDSTILAHFKTIETFSTHLPKLVEQLTTPYSTKEAQFRSIYLWLIHHISYDFEAIDNRRINQSNQDILERKKAICWGYSTILKAMCEEVDIPVMVISGYVRTGLQNDPFLKYPNHAWNAIQINDGWQLVDATWDSQHLKMPSAFYQKFDSDYYFPEPAIFIVNHLPADPQWQLLDCPISIQDFQQPIDSILQIAKNKDCNTALLAPSYHASLNYFDQQLQRAINIYQFNPTDDNRRELAHTQIEYQEHLSKKAERLQLEQKIESLLDIQLQMIELCEVASSLTELYDTQKENCAYNYFNYAVALSQVELTAENEQEKLKQILQFFNLAVKKIEDLPQNVFTKQALTLSTDYINYLNTRLK